MIDGGAIVQALGARAAAGAGPDELLREAVRRMHDAEPHYDWTGIYLLEGDTLVLHNYQGAHTDHDRIKVGVGVCGTAVAEDRDLNIPDVEAIDNYLACSFDTRSELVVLIRDGAGNVLGQIDLDSHSAGAFTERDERQLKYVADWLGAVL